MKVTNLMKGLNLKWLGIVLLLFSVTIIQNGCSSSHNNSTKPSSPANLTATAGDGQVSLSWSASSGATSYNVYESTTSGGTYTKVGAVTGTNDTVTGLTDGASYFFVVTAVNSAGESGYSNQVSATPIASMSSPLPPANLTATAGNAQVLLSWSASTSASLYNVYESTSSNGFFTKIGSTNNAYAIINTNITNGVTYYFVVTAVNSYGESLYSNQASATPSATSPPLPPTNLTATAGNSEVELNWSGETNVTGYNIYYAITSGGPYTKVVTITSTNYVVSGLANGVTYYFVVTAVNSNGESLYSNQASAVPSAAYPPLPPTNLTAIAGNALVSLSWSASTNATGYNIYDSTISGGPYTKVGTTTNINYTVAGLTNGVTYYFVVTSVNGTLESANSNESSATPFIPSITLTLTPSSGTLDAVNLNSMFSENITASIGNTAGTVDPTSISISISPVFSFTTLQGFNSGTFAGYEDIVPAGFLTAGTTYSVTTSFNASIGGNIYSFTGYNTFTTVASAGTPSVVPGQSYIVTITNVTQPSGLASLLSGNIPNLAISVITGTVASNPAAAGADGSMLLYGGAAVSGSPSDITTDFALPLAAIYKGDQFMSFGSAVLSVAGIAVPLQNFNLSGMATPSGITNGVLYGVVHCTDTACSNLGTTVGGVISQYIDANGNMGILGTFNGAPNAFSPIGWIGSGDTTNTNLISGTGATTTTAMLEVTTSSSPLLTTATLPYVILTQTDANNMMSIAAVGQSADAVPLTSPITFSYPLVEPGLAQTPFATAVGQKYQAFFMFGLTNSKTVTFIP